MLRAALSKRCQKVSLIGVFRLSPRHWCHRRRIDKSAKAIICDANKFHLMIICEQLDFYTAVIDRRHYTYWKARRKHTPMPRRNHAFAGCNAGVGRQMDKLWPIGITASQNASCTCIFDDNRHAGIDVVSQQNSGRVFGNNRETRPTKPWSLRTAWPFLTLSPEPALITNEFANAPRVLPRPVP